MDKTENKIETFRLLDSLYRLSDMSQGVPKKLHILSDVVIELILTPLSGSQPATQLSVGGSRSHSGQTNLQLLSLLAH